MPYFFSVYTSLASMPADYSQIGLQHKPICRGIDTVEKALVENLQNFYVVTFDEGELLCVSYFQLLAVKPVHFNLANKKLQQAALSLALRLVKPSLLVAGNLFRHDVQFFEFANATHTSEKQADIFMATTNHLISYTNASGIFLKDVQHDIAAHIQQDNTYIQMQDDVSMEMNIPANWSSFADYEHALKHKYLQRCRKIRTSFEGIHIIKFSEADIKRYSTEMEQLYLQVTKKQLVSMGIINHSFFEELKKSLQDDYNVCGYFHGEKLVAFSSAILHDGEYDMNYIGFDYAYNQSHNLYFNILFHCLENAMSTGCHKLILGRTAPEAKAIMGCSPDYRFSFYKLRNVIVNWFYQMVAAYFKEQQGNKWKDRHPFKSNYYAAAPPNVEQ
ncbi:MAG: GNAT family N-acetyltransferase [Chitinophagaceae bacterium]|nr:GNAT family N-acetyltransferase [Chitinophagaceae bacterium]